MKAQTCTLNTFIKTYGIEGTSYGGFDFALHLPQDNFLVGGILDTSFVLLKLKEDGNLEWTKKFSHKFLPKYSVSIYRARALLDYDGNYLIASNSKILTRVDPNGQLLSTQKIIVPFDTTTIIDMKIAPDGDKVFLLQGEDYRSAGIIARLSPDLSTFRWVKNFNYPAGEIEFDELCLDNNRIIATASTSNTIAFTSVDYSTGNLLQHKNYSFNNNSLLPRSVQKYNDRFLVFCSSGTFLRLSNSLDIMSAFRIVDPSGPTGYPQILVQPDGAFFLTLNSLLTNFMYVSKNDSLFAPKAFGMIGSRTYKRGIAMAQTVDNLYVLNTDIIPYFPAGGNPGVFETGLTLYKTDYSGYVSNNCTASPNRFIIEPISYSSVNYTLYTGNDSFKILTEPIGVSSLTVHTNSLCSSINNCNSLRIIGDTIACKASQFRLSARRNSACSRPVTWKIFQGPQVQYSELNDSSAVFNYTQSGDYSIVATLTGSCSTITDTIKVHVSLPIRLNLGADTTICLGDTVTLKVEGTYKSYKWQNSSSLPYLTVRNSGTYYIEATDYCNNIYRDTINIAANVSEKIGLPVTIEKCPADTIQMSIPSSIRNITWSPENQGYYTPPNLHLYNPFQAMLQVRGIDINGCVVKDSSAITIKTVPPLNLGNDVTICAKDSVTLIANTGFTSYSWNNGMSAAFINVKQPGIYSVQAIAANGCRRYDTAVVTQQALPVVNLGSDEVLCENDSITFNAPFDILYSYMWQDNSTLPRLVARNTGLYFVKVTDNFKCSATDTVRIRSIESKPQNFLPLDTVLCPGFRVKITPLSLFKDYLWNDGSRSGSFFVTQPGQYSLQVTSVSGCIGKDTVLIAEANACTTAIYFSNAFTPNGDGKNEIYYPKVWGLLNEYHLLIYNRFGQKVFETNDSNLGWDGKVNGIEQDTGAFVWYCKYQLLAGPHKNEKGTLLLLR